MKRWLSLLTACALTAGALTASGGSFSTAGESFGEDVVMHPAGYDGTGGELVLTVCLDSSDPRSSQAESATLLAVRTWNLRTATTGNLRTGAVPPASLDFESTVLRTLGLCLGLEDPSDDLGFARATNGVNNSFDRGVGPDAVAGTRDDLRGDDGSLTWFRLLDNDPFTVTSLVDSSTYSRDTVMLPEGDTFAASSTRAAAAALGFPNTEAVMVADLRPGESKRQLTFDDIATLRYAESGLDETAGTADDYTVRLDYLGQVASCDLQVTFDIQGAAATCFGPARRVQDNHFGFTANTMTFSDAVQWHFNPQDILFIDGFETGTTQAWSFTSP